MYNLLRYLTVILFTDCKSCGKIGSSNQSTQNFNVEKFNLRKLSELEVKNQYQIKVLSDIEDKNRAWEHIKATIKSSAKKSRSV